MQSTGAQVPGREMSVYAEFIFRDFVFTVHAREAKKEKRKNMLASECNLSPANLTQRGTESEAASSAEPDCFLLN